MDRLGVALDGLGPVSSALWQPWCWFESRVAVLLGGCWGKEMEAGDGGVASWVLLAGLTSAAELPPQESTTVVPQPA